jgi:ubiquinone/menaquinone biosynthesis C-methylase UbiE
MNEKKVIRRGYDELAETYAAKRSVDEREVAILDELLGSPSEMVRILDAGCGQGTPVLRRLCDEATTVGVDFSREQLRIAAEDVSTARLVHGDMTHLPIQDNVFDAVTAFNSLIHIPLSDHPTVIEEFARVLRPGGTVLLSEAPQETERTNSNWLDSDVEMTWKMAGAQATRNQLQNAGFLIVNEWRAPDRDDEERPKPPFFAAQLDN